MFMENTTHTEEATPRERVEAAADRIAELLNIDPEDVMISASAGKRPYLMLTATQAERMLEHVS